MKGRNVLLTGAHTDLGRAVALTLAAYGATLLMPTRSEHLLADLYDEIADHGGCEPLLITMDIAIADENQFADLATGLRGEVACLHGIAHLQLAAAPLSPLLNSTLDTWQACLQGMLLQPMLLVRSLIPLMLDAEDPSAMFLTLPCGDLGKANWSPVGAALAGLENLCQALTGEHPGIRFSTLDPGPVASDLRRRFYPAEARADLVAVDDLSIMLAFVRHLAARESTLTAR